MSRKVSAAGLMLLLLVSPSLLFAQGATTGSIEGKVDDGSRPLADARIVAIHLPTNATYVVFADKQGFFRIFNMYIGGPYKLTVTYIGYASYEKTGLYVRLGETLNLKVSLAETAIPLKEIVVSAKRSDIIDANRTGAETTIDAQQIGAMPTVGRNLTDFARLSPHSNIGDNNMISVAGSNTRYNAISIDGAINSDIFGLSGNATNGAQTGGTPISIDAIEQLQVAVAPFDVRQSGFAGASINAVTRRGANELSGSLYQFMRNRYLAGKTPGGIRLPQGVERERLPDFTSYTYGVRLGGPIANDKLFFFTSIEMQNDESPQPFSVRTYQGLSSEAQLDAFANKLRTEYGYDPGSFSNNARKLDSSKYFGRLDWNVNSRHKLTIRHSYANNEATMPSSSNSWVINFLNSGVYYPSVTNSSALQFKSNFAEMANDLIVGYTRVREDRDPMGTDFPGIRISDGWATIIAGSELYSTADKLKQDIFTITDNFSIFKGRHAFTLGTNNEFYSINSLAVSMNYGEYTYASLDDFMNNIAPTRYTRNYSVIDNEPGDDSRAVADFELLQWGLYAQDEFQMNDRLKLTYGLRLDSPVFLKSPEDDAHFNTTTIPLIEAAGYDLKGARSGDMPEPQLLFAPRFGFNYDMGGNETTQLRGGTGIFTSRLPLVWPGSSYVNNGMTIASISQGDPHFTDGSPLTFNPDPFDQPSLLDLGGTSERPSGQIDIFASDFKFPQIFRSNVAVDRKLPWSLIGTLELIYSKTINNVDYKNLNILPASRHLTGQDGVDIRPIYDWGRIDPTYSNIMLGTNTDEGYAYNFTAQVARPFAGSFSGSVAYTFGRAKAVNDGKYYQNSWQWTYMEQINGRNYPTFDYSVYDLGSRIVSSLSYTYDRMKHANTTISLFYNGQSGRRYSYTYGYGQLMTQEVWSFGNDLIYVPAHENEINLVDIGTQGSPGYISAHDQWLHLADYIDNDDYLRTRRGQFAERNGARLPWEDVFDVNITQDLYIDHGGKRHTLQFSLDIFNFGNLLNKDWGRRFYVSDRPYSIIQFVGFEPDNTTPRFTFQKPTAGLYNIDDSGINSSRWQAQFGVRYLF